MPEQEAHEVNVVRWTGMNQEQRREALRRWDGAAMVSVNPPVRRSERAVMDIDPFGKISIYVLPHWTEQQVIANATQRQITASNSQVVGNVEAQMQSARTQRPDDQIR